MCTARRCRQFEDEAPDGLGGDTVGKKKPRNLFLGLVHADGRRHGGIEITKLKATIDASAFLRLVFCISAKIAKKMSNCQTPLQPGPGVQSGLAHSCPDGGHIL